MIKIDKKLSERISKEDFFDYLDKLKDRSDMFRKVYESTGKSLDLINFEDYICEPLRIIEKAFFSKIEYDMISWFLYEYDEGKMKIYDKDTNEVLAEITDNEALWDYLNDDKNKCWEEVDISNDELMDIDDFEEIVCKLIYD